MNLLALLAFFTRKKRVKGPMKTKYKRIAFELHSALSACPAANYALSHEKLNSLRKISILSLHCVFCDAVNDI